MQTLTDVLTRTATDFDGDIRCGRGEVGRFLFDEGQRDGVGDRVGPGQQRRPGLLDGLLIRLLGGPIDRRETRCVLGLGFSHLPTFAHYAYSNG